jgi:hypothetical protein
MAQKVLLAILLNSCFFWIQSSSLVFGETYEGFIGKYPVWVIIERSQQDSSRFTGTCIYKKTGASLRLEGTQEGHVVTLTEYDSSDIPTGTFTCTQKDSRISGNWISTNRKNKFNVGLQIADPQVLNDMLKEMALTKFEDGLLREIQPDKNCVSGFIKHTFKNDFLRSLSLIIENNCEDNHSSMTEYKTYDIETGAIIDIWNEIDPKQMKQLLTHLTKVSQEQLTAHREAFPDSLWIKTFSRNLHDSLLLKALSANSQKSLVSLFTLGDAGSFLKHFYITDDGVHFIGNRYFGFEKMTQYMDFTIDVVLTQDNMSSLLKKDSVVRKIIE